MSTVTAAPAEAPAIAPVSPRRPLVMIGMAIVLGGLFTWLAPGDQVTTFIFNLGEQFFEKRSEFPAIGRNVAAAVVMQIERCVAEVAGQGGSVIVVSAQPAQVVAA